MPTLNSNDLLEFLLQFANGNLEISPLESNGLCGVDKEIVETLNQVLKFQLEFSKKVQQVGNEARLRGNVEMISVEDARGYWRSNVDSMNNIIEASTHTTAQVLQAISKVSDGDFSFLDQKAAENVNKDVVLKVQELGNSVQTVVKEINEIFAKTGKGEFVNVNSEQWKGSWKQLINNANEMSSSLKCQVAAMDTSALAAAEKDFSKYVITDTFGAFRTLATRMNKMIHNFNDLAIAHITLETAHHEQYKMLSNFAHEIRTPMNGIIGMSELTLDQQCSAPEHHDYVSLIHSSGSSLLRMVNAMLDFAKLQCASMDLDPVEFTLLDVFEGLQEKSLYETNDKAEVIFDVDICVPERLFGDVYRLRQVLLILLSNAIKYTSSEVVVSVKTTHTTENKVILLFTVKDTGVGIPDHRLKDIFKPLSTGGYARKYGGLGISLSIAAEIVKLMNGKITVESTCAADPQDMHGTQFFVSVPIQIDKKSQPITMRSSHTVLEGKTVLIMAENMTLQQVIRKTIDKWKMKIIVAKDTEEMMKVIANQKDIPFILMDDTNDFKVLDKLNAFVDPDVYSVIVMTTKRDALQRTNLENYSVIRHLLTKPFLQHNLLESLLKLPRPFQFKPVSVGIISILLVDDNLISLKVVTKMLQQMKSSYNVITSQSGSEAIELFQQRDFDLVLIDESMPGMSGIEATAKIREHERRSNKMRTPIVGITIGQTNETHKWEMAGANAFLSKPVQREMLRVEMDKFFGSKG